MMHEKREDLVWPLRVALTPKTTAGLIPGKILCKNRTISHCDVLQRQWESNKVEDSVATSSNCSGPQQGLKPRSSESTRFLGEPPLAKFIRIFLGDRLHATLQTSRNRKFRESTFQMNPNSCFPRNVLLVSWFAFCRCCSRDAVHRGPALNLVWNQSFARSQCTL